MAEKIEIVEEEDAVLGDGTWIGSVRKVLLGGIEAATLAQSEAEAFVARLVQRGQMAEKDGRSLLAELKKRQPKVPSPGQMLEGQITAVLRRLNVPTKDEIDTLSEKIETLSGKVDQLRELLVKESKQ